MNPDDAQSALDHAPPDHTEDEEWIGAKQIGLTKLASGCVLTMAGAVVTCCLLVMNGAFIMALLATAAAGGVNWLDEKPSLSQFILFSAPILLTVVQWILIDTLRWILRRRRSR